LEQENLEEFRDYYQKFVQRTNLLDEIRKDAHILVKFLVAARSTEELNFSKSILNKVRPKQWSFELDDISRINYGMENWEKNLEKKRVGKE
jgi:hypothetical protein